MESDILALKWGIGYYLFYPPYSDTTVKFSRVNIPNNVKYVDLDTQYEFLQGISFNRKIGIMDLSITDCKIHLHANKVGSCKRIESKKYQKLMSKLGNNYTIPILKPVINPITQHKSKADLQVILEHSKAIMDESDLKLYLTSIYKICNYTATLTGQPVNDIWGKLFDYALKISKSIDDKFIVIAHYSNGTGICNRCNETDIRVLSIDHINGGGTQHKKTIKGSFYRWLINNNFPSGYQVLCMNCQWRKRSENNEYAKQPKTSKTTKTA